MANLNNVDVSALQKALKASESDNGVLHRVQVMSGEWVLEPSEHAQFRADIAFETGKAVFESDQPTMLGGGGRSPSPMHYCFYGLAACYAGTYANTAAMMGVRLRKLSVRVEAKQDFSRVFGLSDEPFIRDLNIVLTVRGDASDARLGEIEHLAYQRCPAVYCYTHAIDLKTRLVVEQQPGKGDILEALRHVYDPDFFDRSIVDMGLVTEGDVTVSQNKVSVQYRLSAPICPFSAVIGLMIKHVLEKRLGIMAEVRLMPGHYQFDVVNEVLGSDEKASELLIKMDTYGILNRCIR
jgi:uncharacterized OsmC-like protein/metal-sulfur cluster biosynthetic enzyme